jgi:hypothetical protein
MYYLVPGSKNINILNNYLSEVTHIVYNISNKNNYIEYVHYYPSLQLYKCITKQIKLQYAGNRKYILLMFENESGLHHLINEINKSRISLDKFLAKQSYDITMMKLVDFNNMYSKEVIVNNKDLHEDWLELHRYNDFARKNYEEIEYWTEEVFIKDAFKYFYDEGLTLPELNDVLPEEMRLKLQ